jgi:diphthine synthase
MLFFVGLGLYDEKDVSLKGLEAVRSADMVYAEFYTSRLMGASLEGCKASMEKRFISSPDRKWKSIPFG